MNEAYKPAASGSCAAAAGAPAAVRAKPAESASATTVRVQYGYVPRNENEKRKQLQLELEALKSNIQRQIRTGVEGSPVSWFFALKMAAGAACERWRRREMV